MQNVHFTPPDIAPLFEVNVSTVKRWIDRGLLPAERTTGGHRRVSRAQLMEFIQGMEIGSRRSYVLRRLVSADDAEASDNIFRQYRTQLQRQPDQARAILERLVIRQWSMARIIDQVIAPTLRWIGSEWEAGQLSIYEEHRLSFLIRQHLMRLDDLLPKKAGRRRALLLCPTGEQHELPLQMLALVLRQHRWQPEILGINVPIAELKRAIVKLRPEILILSSTYWPAASVQYLRQAERLAQRYKIKLFYGGTGWKRKLATGRTSVRTGSADSFEAALLGLAKRSAIK